MMRIAPSSSIPNIEQAAGRKNPIVRRPLVFRLLEFVANADRRNREMRELERLDESRLKDIGASRSELNEMFRRRYGRRPSDQAPDPIISGRAPW